MSRHNDRQWNSRYNEPTRNYGKGRDFGTDRKEENVDKPKEKESKYVEKEDLWDVLDV